MPDFVFGVCVGVGVGTLITGWVLLRRIRELHAAIFALARRICLGGNTDGD